MRTYSATAGQIARARLIHRTLGTHAAAVYLRLLDYTLDQALGILLRTVERQRDPCQSLRERGLL
jgi:hypothetical protein